MELPVGFPYLLLSLAILASRSEAVGPPSTLPAGWAYQGCYTDVGRTINADGFANSTGMTVESCITYCSTRGYQYAGTEYYQECYCGSSLAPAATHVAEADCSLPCTGNASEACGGGSRLSLYYSSTPTGPQANPGVNGWSHVGCYAEGTSGRALTHPAGDINGADMTVARCTSACKTAGYLFAGVEYGGECYCDNSPQNGAVPAASGCSMVCNGDHSELCGGPSRLNLYHYQPSSSSSISSSTSTRSSTTTSPTSSSTRTSTSSSSTRTSTSSSSTRTSTSSSSSSTRTSTSSSSTQTSTSSSSTRTSTSSSSSSTRTSTTSSSTRTSTSSSSSTRSSTSTSSSSSSTRTSTSTSSTSTRSSSTSTSSTSSSSITSSPSSTAPVGMPSGWTYQGCWIDGAHGGIMDKKMVDSPNNTQESCAQQCNAGGYTVSGTEYGAECYCGNYLKNGATKAAETDCNMACPGKTTEMCGAGNRLTVWSLGTPTVYAVPSIQTTGLGSWAYQGCYEDNAEGKGRTFFWKVELFMTNLTPSLCLARCAQFGYMAAGLEYGQECYCGDPANIATTGASLRPDSECQSSCVGLPSAICGNGDRLTTYFWTGTPFYSWTFPQTPATAGQYQFLIGGVTVPLMTMQSVTGKVSFLSKGPGTGRGNETGAYELDLTALGNFTQAWRPLHVRTDIFCSAGVILPDKAGRQLTVGGWAGDSAQGTRLYWPDGSAGVWGTHDWQENKDEVSLQAQRWYASALIMANGSVLIVGGEECSNCVATPSLEILPYTGSPPLYMDWLERTNPNNLYPFLAILPSGGIFVGYWNEARILDPATFATRKMLPNMPGSVNDDTSGGRTYPQEGAAVLLPQRAPYTDPLGILICGGSTVGPGYALDTCVSTYPDAANPTWVIERMPTFRVMPCMAPFPDGTYLIANGAYHGWAGFGLATEPNKNAWLYDPKKPTGSRFTVMANTTIGRLYHSEAITLLDGRVLISGSDPTGNIDTATPENPEEYRVEVFIPPYLLTGKPRPTFTITTANKDWTYGQAAIPFTLGAAAQNGNITATLLGAVSSTHGNAMGGRTIMPAVRCSGVACSVDAPPNANVCPPGWYQLFVLDGGVPAVGTYVRIGGDPARLGNWPPYSDFLKPGV